MEAKDVKIAAQKVKAAAKKAKLFSLKEELKFCKKKAKVNQETIERQVAELQNLRTQTEASVVETEKFKAMVPTLLAVIES